MTGPLSTDLDRLRSELDAATRRAFQRAERIAPPGTPTPRGVQVALAHHGRLLFSTAIGIDGVGRPLTDRTRFRVASQSKIVTSLLALRLADAGLLDLDAPVWPGLTAWEPSPEQAGGFDHRRITTRHLLSHSAGLANLTVPARDTSQLAGTGDEAALLTGELAPAVRLIATAGEHVEYTTAGYVIGALAIEHAAGARLATLARTHLTDPLGLDLTYDRPTRPDDGTGRGITHDGAPAGDAFFAAHASSGVTACSIDLARLLSIAAADANGFGPRVFRQQPLQGALRPAGPPGLQDKFAMGFVLAEWSPYRVFHHVGHGIGTSGITEGIRSLGCAVSVQVVVPPPAGVPQARRIGRALLAVVSSACGVMPLSGAAVHRS